MSKREKDAGKRRLNQAIDAEVHRRLRLWAFEQGENLPEAIEDLLRQALGMEKRKQFASA